MNTSPKYPKPRFSAAPGTYLHAAFERDNSVLFRMWPVVGWRDMSSRGLQACDPILLGVEGPTYDPLTLGGVLFHAYQTPDGLIFNGGFEAGERDDPEFPQTFESVDAWKRYATKMAAVLRRELAESGVRL